MTLLILLNLTHPNWIYNLFNHITFLLRLIFILKLIIKIFLAVTFFILAIIFFLSLMTVYRAKAWMFFYLLTGLW